MSFAGKQELPGILVGGRFPGVSHWSSQTVSKLSWLTFLQTFSELWVVLSEGREDVFLQFHSEEAVEYDELSTFLRLNETWDHDVDGDRPAPPVQPVGVPGASSPSQMTNHKPSFAASPSPLKSKNKGQSAREFDVGSELVGFGLQGVKVTDDELRELVEELGLDEADAGELVKGLGGGNSEDALESLQTEAKSVRTESKGKEELEKDSKDGEEVDRSAEPGAPASWSHTFFTA